MTYGTVIAAVRILNVLQSGNLRPQLAALSGGKLGYLGVVPSQRVLVVGMPFVFTHNVLPRCRAGAQPHREPNSRPMEHGLDIRKP